MGPGILIVQQPITPMMTARTQDRGVNTSDQEQLGSSTSRSLIQRSNSLHRKDVHLENTNENSLKGKL